jgi:hypothetical protein
MFAFAYAGLAQNDGLVISILFGTASFIVGIRMARLRSTIATGPGNA